jgi:molecular chaperone DnaJ
MPTDYYEVLGVQKGASEGEIKQAYRRLARTHHPDVAADKAAAETKFKEINEAYSVLSDGEKRQAYDRYGHAGVGAGGAGAGGFGQGFGGAEGFTDIFDMFFGNVRGAERGARASGPARGSDLRYDLSISLEEAFEGAEHEITFQHLASCETCKGAGAKPGTLVVSCDKCNGTGIMRGVRQTPLGQFMSQSPCTKCNGEGHTIPTPCDTCHGRGRVQRQRSMQVKVPAGVDDGSRIRIAGQGEGGQRGGPAGDLYVYLEIEAHEIFQREGLDISLHMPVPFPTAALGGEIEVPALSGSTLKVDLQPGTQNGTRYRLRGHGMPSVRGGGFGDMYVIVQVSVPKQLTKRERELLEELSTLQGETVDGRSFFDRVKDAFRPE